MSSSSSSSDSFSSESDSENRLTRTSKNASWKGKKKQLESGIQQTT